MLPLRTTMSSGENNQLPSMILSMGLKSLHFGVEYVCVMSVFLGVSCLSSNRATLV